MSTEALYERAQEDFRRGLYAVGYELTRKLYARGFVDGAGLAKQALLANASATHARLIEDYFRLESGLVVAARTWEKKVTERCVVERDGNGLIRRSLEREIPAHRGGIRAIEAAGCYVGYLDVVGAAADALQRAGWTVNVSGDLWEERAVAEAFARSRAAKLLPSPAPDFVRGSRQACATVSADQGDSAASVWEEMRGLSTAVLVASSRSSAARLAARVAHSSGYFVTIASVLGQARAAGADFTVGAIPEVDEIARSDGADALCAAMEKSPS